MIRPAPFACDVCGKEKQETNHWFILKVDHDVGEEVNALYSMFKWDNDLALASGVKHLCGSDCAAQMQSRLLSHAQGAKDIRDAVLEEKIANG